MNVFQNVDPTHFCIVFSTICGTVVKKNDEPRSSFFKVLGTSWPILMLRGVEIFGAGMCDRTAGFYHVLSVFMVPSVSVESAMESNDVSYDVFLRCVFEWYGAKSHDHCST